MKLCDYGCGQEGKYKFKNGKHCCSEFHSQCPAIRGKNKENSSGEKHHYFNKKRSNKTKNKIGNSNKGKLKGRPPWNKGKTYEQLYGKEKAEILKQNQSNRMKHNIPWNGYTIEYIKEYHPLFFRIEKIRHNPDKPNEKEIQVHCKNHKCENSKEKGGWFTPTKTQIQERMRQIEYGQGGCYFYCSQECKDSCILYNLRSDPFKDETELPYTQEEYNLWKQTVLEQDNYQCQMCGSKENLHCHHIVPVKENEMLALDPDNCIVLCQKCHYEIGHKKGTECSTGNLAKRQCKRI